MSKEIIFEITLTGMSFCTGVGFMMVYDLLRAVRLFIPHHFLLTGLEDLAFWLYAAVMTFSLLLELNEGVLRGYAIVMVLAGMILFDRTLSRIWLKVLKKIRKCIKIKF